MKLHSRIVSAVGLAVMVLSGCSTEPSDGTPSAQEIEKALKIFLASTDNFRGESGKRALSTMKMNKLGCKPDTVSDYLCEIEMTSEEPGRTGKKSEPLSIPVMKGSAGWMVPGDKEYCGMLMNKPASQLSMKNSQDLQNCLLMKMKNK